MSIENDMSKAGFEKTEITGDGIAIFENKNKENRDVFIKFSKEVMGDNIYISMIHNNKTYSKIFSLHHITKDYKKSNFRNVIFSINLICSRINEFIKDAKDFFSIESNFNAHISVFDSDGPNSCGGLSLRVSLYRGWHMWYITCVIDSLTLDIVLEQIGISLSTVHRDFFVANSTMYDNSILY